MANLIYNQINLHDSGLQRLALKLSFRRDWLDEGKNIEVSQSEAEKGGSIPVSTWDTTGDLTRRYDCDPPPPHFFLYRSTLFTWITYFKVKQWILPEGDKFAPLII